MPVLYRGAALGSHWYTNNPMFGGFIAQSPGMTPSVNIMVSHIIGLTTQSPYISLTYSFAIARQYAEVGAGGIASSTNPAYVYLIDLPDPLPSNLDVFDPVQEISKAMQKPPMNVPYQHEGASDYLLGVVDPNTYGHLLISHRLSGNSVSSQLDAATPPLLAIVRALRDSELLATGVIPAGCVRRIPVY